jgi:tetratricopeptide (TPR) repeat protein
MSSLGDLDAFIGLARRELAAGQLAAAQARCLQVLGAYRHHPGALEVLGEVLCSDGRHEEAVRIFNALTLMQPTVAGHWQNLGTVLRPTKRYAQALQAFERALQLGPPSAGLLYNLGVLQMDRCDYGAAYLALRDAVALAPRDATIRWAFAQCCFDSTRREEALAALEDWQSFDGLNSEVTVLIALLLIMMGSWHLAQSTVERLAANPPRKGRAALGFVSILERLHRLDEARVAMDRLKTDDPSPGVDSERLLMSAVLAERVGQYDEAYQILALALRNHQEFVHRHNVLVPYARIADMLERYDEAYAAAEEAHRSQAAYLDAVVGKLSAEESQIWSLTADGCDAKDVVTWDTADPPPQESPIFIVGFPRSGTTLLEQVLDAHPELQSMDEQPFLLQARTEVMALGIRSFAELGKLTSQNLEQIRANYWERVQRRGRLSEGRRLVDKNPLNMNLLPLIRRLFPNSRIVLMIRHPCDTVLSCFFQNFRSPSLARACRDLTTLARGYDRSFGFWYSQHAVLRACTYELRYERLTTDFASEVLKLCEFLDLSWNDAMLAHGAHALAKGFISTPSYAQVTQPVSNRSMGRWKHYERHFDDAIPILMPWIDRWGYEID